MSTTRPIYPRPPIVEAVIDVHLREDVSAEDLANSVGAQLLERYSGSRKPGDASKGQPILLLSSDGLRGIGFAPKRMSVHVLAPYPGWESFVDQAKHAVSALLTRIREPALSGIGVRYIDRIEFKTSEIAFNDYFTVMPRRPTPMPEQLLAFTFSTQAMDPKDNTLSVLTMASMPNETGAPVILYDLNMVRVGDPAGRLDDGSWLRIVRELHARQREMFEESITDKMRELFQ